MGDINGGAIKYTAEMDISGLKKSLKEGESGLKGLSQVAKETGTDIDKVFDVTSENIKIQKQVIADLEKEYKKLQDTINKMAPGKGKLSIMGDAAEIAKEIEAEKKALSDLEEMIQQSSTKHESLRQKLTQVKNEMMLLAAAGQQNSQRYAELIELAKQYQEAIDEVNGTMNALGGNTALNALVETLSLASSGMAIYQGIMALTAGENEKLDRIMVNLQATMSIAIGIQQLQNSLQSDSAIIQAVVALQARARARAEALATSSTIASTVAQRAFNMVANANVYILLATAIITVVGALILFSNQNKKAAEDIKALNKATADGAAEQIIAYKKLQAQWNSLGNDLKAKEKFITDNKDAFKDLGYAVEDVADAENVLIKQTTAVLAAMMLRARAAAQMEIAQDNYKKYLENQSDVNANENKYKKDGWVGRVNKSVNDFGANNLGFGISKGQNDQYLKDANLGVLKSAKELEAAAELEKKAKLKLEATPPKKGTEEWYTAELTRLQDLKKKAQVGSKEWENYKKEIDKIDELINPKKPKKPKKEKELAEVLSPGSVTKLQQELALIDNSLERVGDNGKVALRAVDKYGKEYTTNQVRSLDEVQKMRIDKAQELAEAEKKIQVKSIKEQSDESNILWQQYYSTVESLGKDSADKIYGDLIKNNKSQFDNLQSLQKQLVEKSTTGTLTNEEQEVLTTINTAIDEMIGKQSSLESFKTAIGQTFLSMASDAERLLYVQDQLKQSTTEDKSTGKTAFLTETERNLSLSLKNQYQEFINEHKSFEEQKTNITDKYARIRSDIEKSSLSDSEKDRLTKQSNKDQAKEISSASFEAFKKTDLWVKAFGDLSKIGPKTLLKMKKGLQEYLNSNKDNLTVVELKKTQDQIEKLDELITSNNPFKAIGVAVDNYRKKRKELADAEEKYGKGSDEYKEKLKEVNKAFVSIVEITGAAAKATVEVVGTIGDAFGGLSDELKQTLAEVQQLIDGIVNTVAGYFSSNYGQMISGIVQIVGAMVKLLSGDKGRERQIRAWQTAVEYLKTAYDSLQHSIQRTAGEAAIAAQRGLVENLEEQKRLVTQMRDEESKKKKADKDKIAGFNSQISQLTQQIEDVFDNFQKSVTTTDFKDLSENIANALIEAFGKGEDAAEAFDKVVDDVMKNAVANALRVKILEPAVKNMVDNLYSSMGFGNGNAHVNDAQINKYKDDISELEKKIKTAESSNYYNPENTKYVLALKEQKQKLLDLIGGLQAQNASTPAGGSFDGLTPEEREKIKALGTNAMQQYMDALKQYEDLFGASAENAQGLKGDIKGITEKTAGALEAQLNAMRINIVKNAQDSQLIFKNSLENLVRIEFNTRRLHNMDKTLTEMNSKMNNTLAGV